MPDSPCLVSTLFSDPAAVSRTLARRATPRAVRRRRVPDVRQVRRLHSALGCVGWSAVRRKMEQLPQTDAEEMPHEDARIRGRPLQWLVAPVLGCVGLVWAVIYRYNGLHYSPDSGLYLLHAARLHHELDYGAGDPTYAPGFAIAVAAMMVMEAFPGLASAWVLGASLGASLIACHSAARSAGATQCWAVGAACLLLVIPSTSLVYSYAWSEGLLIAILLSVVAFLSKWLCTQQKRWLVLALVVSATAPLVKFIAVILPAAVAATMLVAHWRFRALSSHRMGWAAAAMATSLPIAAHVLFNLTTHGVVTGHAPSRTPFFLNVAKLGLTGLQAFSPLVWVFFSLVLTRFYVRRGFLIKGRAGLVPLVTAGLACGYFILLVLGASRASVDALNLRLAAPGLALLPLCFVQCLVATKACSSEPSRAKRILLDSLAPTSLLLAAGIVVHGASFLRTIGETASVGRPRAPFEAGYLRSSTRAALSRFYDKQLRVNNTVSVTFVESYEPPGAVRREWYSIASALAAPPITTPPHWSQLVSPHHEVIRVKVGQGKTLLFIPAGLPEQRPFSVAQLRSSAERERLVGERISSTLSRVVGAARAHARKTHWVLVPKRGRWFDLRVGQKLASAAITGAISVGDYDAYELSLRRSDNAR